MPGLSLIELAHADPSDFAHVHTILTDIDDTLTNDGRLSAQAYAAMERLNDAGFRVIPLTGRPAGWCDLIARFWPVAGVIGENGAFAFRYEQQSRRMMRLYDAPEAARIANLSRLRALGELVVSEVPGTALSADQPYRISDIAIDVREDVPPLDQADIQRVLTIFEQHGATAKLSSIHVNAWFGNNDKLSMAKRFLLEAFGVRLLENQSGIVFVGDSPNDEPMFEAMRLSVGVANVREFLNSMKSTPRYVARDRGGQGFVELAQALLMARQTLKGDGA